MNILSVSNPRWSDSSKSRFDVDLETEELGVIPYTAAPDSPTEYGQEIWEKGTTGEYGAIRAFTPPTLEEQRAAMPNLTARQLRLGLLHLNKLGDVPLAISALPEPDKSQAQIEWDFAMEFSRVHPLIVRLIPILSLDDEEVDRVWQQFATV